MADMTPILIKDLAEQTTAADTDYMVIGGADAKKIKWSTIWGLIRDKLGIGTATLATNDKTVKGAINELNTNIDKMIKVKKVTVPSFFVEKIQAQYYTMVHIPKKQGETSPHKRLAVKISAYSTQGAVGPVWFTVNPSSGGDWYVYIYNHRNEDANNIYLQFEIYYV